MTGTPLNFEEIETIKLYRADGFTFHAISQKINRDPKTVKKTCLDPVIASQIIELKEVLADQYENLARRMMDSITEEDIQKINAYQRTIASGICTDKMRLLRNESTHNVSLDVIHSNMAERQKRRQELLAELGESTGGDDVENEEVIENEQRLSKLTGEDYGLCDQAKDAKREGIENTK